MNEPTVHDLLARVKTAADDGERAAAFEAAWQLAERGTSYPSSDWRAILEALVETGAAVDRLRTCAERVLAAATIELDTWGFAAAIVALSRIGAEPAARTALAACRVVLEERSSRSYEWGLVAQGISGVEAYLPEVRALLARGAEVATGRGDFDGLAGLASHVHRIGHDPAGALELQRRAEDLWRARAGAADGELRQVWPVANGWHALDCPGERDRLLAEVAARASTLDDFLTLALIWRSHQDPRAAAMIRDAVPHARSPDDWYQVAERAHECDAGRDLISEALVRCKAGSPGPELLARVEQSAHAWLGVHRDHAASVRPEDLRPRRRLLAGWSSSASGLFDWLCDRMTAERIELIARADYGMDLAAHRAAIATMVDDRVIPPVLAWIPGEVIELTRWSSGDRVDHVARAFASALLLVYGAEPATNAPILIESVLALDPGAVPLAIALLVHVHEHDEAVDPALLYAIALVASRTACSPARIEAVLDACIAELQRRGAGTAAAGAGSFDAAAALCGELAGITTERWKAVSAVAVDSEIPALSVLATAVAAMTE